MLTDNAEMITEQKKEFRKKMRQKRLELKQMMQNRRQGGTANTYKAPNNRDLLPRKEFHSASRGGEPDGV